MGSEQEAFARTAVDMEDDLAALNTNDDDYGNTDVQSRHGGPDTGIADFRPPNTAPWQLVARKFAETSATLSTNTRPDHVSIDFWSDWRLAFLVVKRIGLDRISTKDFHRLENIDTRIEKLKAREIALWGSSGNIESLDPVQVRFECQKRILSVTDRQKALMSAIIALKRDDVSFLTFIDVPENHAYSNIARVFHGIGSSSPQLFPSLLAQAQRDYDDATKEKTREESCLGELDELHRLQKEKVEILERLTRRYETLQGKKSIASRRLPMNSSEKILDRSFWAICIGINKYGTLRPLNGAVKDAEAVKEYLVHDLGVPDANVKLLTNSAATRSEIMGAFFDHLRDNSQILRGDPIIIFFAGHGTSYDAADVFPDTPASIEAICPVNRGAVVDGKKVLDISDREINLFLSELRDAKGNNITLIMDCCFSGGVTRSSASPDAALIRVAPPLPKTLQDMLEAAELNPRKRWAAGAAVTENWTPDMTSHVVIAACQDYEKAWETTAGRGAFTAALVDALKTLNLGNTTYRNLIDHIGRLPRQKPLAAGSRVDTAIFSM